MFTPALTQIGGGTGYALLDLIVQFAAFALIVGAVYFLIIRPIQRRATRGASVTDEEAQGEEGANVGSLMSTIQDQAVEIRGKHANAVSNLLLDFEILTDRIATIGSQVNRAVQAARKSEASVALLTTSNDDLKRKLSDAEREVVFLRPETNKLGEELRNARKQLTESERRLVTLEAECSSAQKACNDLLDKLATSDAARQRMTEEKTAVAQKLNERDFTIQALLRENTQLKSEAASMVSSVESAEQEARAWADKYTGEHDNNTRAGEAVISLQLQLEQIRKDNLSQVQHVEGRKSVISEALAIKERQLNESENKRLALEAKVDYLTKMNQRLRDEARRNLDHIGGLETSNRKLLDSLAEQSPADNPEDEAVTTAPTARAQPRLVVPETKPVRSEA
jgi:preprotein translocase subunit YajC/DNA repair exonuclease SbcCD ATPase subunit